MPIVRFSKELLLPGGEFRSHIISSDDEFEHSHDCFEIVLIMNGTIRHLCNGIQTRLNRNDLVILRPGDTHRYIREENVPCTHRDLMISIAQTKYSAQYVNSQLFSVLLLTDKPPVLHISENTRNYIEEKIAVINKMKYYEESLKASIQNGFIASLLSLFFENVEAADNASLSTQYPYWFNQFLSLLHTPEVILGGIKTIKEKTDYNYSYVCRIFKKYTGVTITDYLQNIRLNAAAIQLVNSNTPVINIAMDVGYDSISYFNCIFKKKFKMTPQEYRSSQSKY